MDWFQWFSIIVILGTTLAGAQQPLSHRGAGSVVSFPRGEAFSSGVFLALALVMMLPSAYTLLDRRFPDLQYPVASLIAIVSFLVLLSVSSVVRDAESGSRQSSGDSGGILIPIIMTLMIAIPSFFLGTALGVSPSSQAVLILVAILLHKSSAAFALALRLVHSPLSKPNVLLVFAVFAFSTPVGIVVGANLQGGLSGSELLLARGLVMAMAAGTFLFLGTTADAGGGSVRRDLRALGFLAAGALVTGLVRLLIGEAHSMG